jgi:hypothetical protein
MISEVQPRSATTTIEERTREETEEIGAQPTTYHSMLPSIALTAFVMHLKLAQRVCTA